MAYRPRVLAVDEGGTGATNPGDALTNLGAFSDVNIQVFRSSGTYTPTTNMVYCIVEMVGGGGGGGGTTTTSATTISYAGGGAAGEFAKGVFTASSIGSSQIVTIGSGGSGGTSGGGNGVNGGTTSLGSLMSCVGGGGGLGSPAATTMQPGGGDGGTGGTGGNVRSQGASAQFGLGNTALVGASWCGNGAPSKFGGGTRQTNVSGVQNANGIGDGGGGAGSQASTTGLSGGNGTNGIIIITEFIS